MNQLSDQNYYISSEVSNFRCRYTQHLQPYSLHHDSFTPTMLCYKQKPLNINVFLTIILPVMLKKRTPKTVLQTECSMDKVT